MPENSKSASRLIAPLFILLSTNCFATNYYVSSMGNDANPGTSVVGAWATINKVNSKIFLPGDALYFEGGQTFSGSIFLNGNDANDPNNIFVISSYGTGRATINAGTSYGFYAYNTQGFTLSNLIFDGNAASSNTDAGVKVIVDLLGDVKFSNISVNDIEVKNFGAEGVKFFASNNLTGYQNIIINGISVHDVTKNGIVVFSEIAQTLVGWPNKNVFISNSEVYHVPGSLFTSTYEGNGIVISGVDSGVIQYCVAHDNGQNNSHVGGPVGIWSLESNHVTIQFCESYKNHNGTGSDGAGFDLDGGVTNSVIQYNYAHDNDGAGYLLGQYQNARPWSNNTVRYNISENDGVTNEGGIGLFKGPGTTMSGANIFNNTIYVSPQAGNSSICAAYLENWTTGINNVSFYNNIFITNGGVTLIRVPSGYAAFFAGNIYWSTGSPFSIDYQGSNYTSLTAWRTATGNEKVNASNTGYSGDPLLTNTGSGGTVGFGSSLFSLNAYKVNSLSSLASNTALNLNFLYTIDVGSTDFWGTALPGGNANSIGANQYSVTLPLKLLDFHGSCWGVNHQISWITAEESDLKSFELIKSGDGINFGKLADIKPKGNNSRYSYENDMTSPGNNYYQLRMTDLDGSVTYSAIVNVICERVTDKVNIWPNPFVQAVHVTIESTTSGPAKLVLYDAAGKVVLQWKFQFHEGNNLVNCDGLDKLPTGVYYLRIIHQNKTEYFKLIRAGS